MRPIVRVKNLSKYYSLLKPRGARPTLREAFVAAVQAPLSRISGRERRGRETLWALRDVTFDVEPGEVVGVIGPNGAGKSTLLKILSRITKPSTGEVDLYGRVGSLLSVGTGFHPNLTGRENIFFHGNLLGMRRAEIKRKFDEIVAFAEVEQFLETAVKHYSAGMYVRLAFAIAAHVEPEILLLDEVIAAGDDAFQRKCVEKILEMPLKGHTVFFVSHNLSVIQKLCPRVLLIESGVLYEDGEAACVIAKYLGGVSHLGS
ncbi:MAG: ABC transporter ATP-binding protein [Acidobacteria bacterium]|nr:ABC transporter ATP-binding protein [Acidobacteriota bacterium]